MDNSIPCARRLLCGRAYLMLLEALQNLVEVSGCV
jgi:hypothetical protein